MCLVPWDLKNHDMIKNIIPHGKWMTQWCPALVWEAYSILSCANITDLALWSARPSFMHYQRDGFPDDGKDTIRVIRPYVMEKYSGKLLCPSPYDDMEEDPALTLEQWGKTGARGLGATGKSSS